MWHSTGYHLTQPTPHDALEATGHILVFERATGPQRARRSHLHFRHNRQAQGRGAATDLHARRRGRRR